MTSEARTRVRTQLDVDSVDLPDVHLDWFLDDAYEATIGVRTNWPFFEATGTITLTANDGSYPIPTSPTSFREIKSARVESPSDVVLSFIDHDLAESRWFEPERATGTPQWFSLWANEIHLWPAPAASGTLVIRGYRNPTNWLAGASNQIDCDERLHTAVVLYAISRAYHQLEDEVLAAEYMNQWAAKAQNASDDIMRANQYRPRVMSRGTFRRQAFPWVKFNP